MSTSVLIIGRPNVGKSTLFNRLCGTRRALVHHVPGTTRDINSDSVVHDGRRFTFSDSAGWSDDDAMVFSADTRRQLERALDTADVVVLVVDGAEGLHPDDRRLAELLRRRGRAPLVAVNKIDTGAHEPRVADFYALGFPTVVGFSGLHGTSIPDLLDAVAAAAGAERGETSVDPAAVRIILVGKPNVGKSSLMNRLTGHERSIVDNKPGTTREALDAIIDRGDRRYQIIDTPGLHRRHKFTDDLEYLSALSAHRAVERADVAILVLDVDQGIGETEARIAEIVLENRRACVIAVNKWDLPDDRTAARAEVLRQIEQKLQFLRWTNTVFVSARSGQRVERILEEAAAAYGEFSRSVPQADLSDVLREAEHLRPVTRLGKVLRLKSIEQSGIRPPTFTITVNDPLLVHFSYRRFLENRLRERFGFRGTPLVLRFTKK